MMLVKTYIAPSEIQGLGPASSLDAAINALAAMNLPPSARTGA